MRRPRGWVIVALAAIAACVLALALAAAVSGPGSPAVRVEPEVQFALPPASLGCSGSTPLAGGGGGCH